MEPEGARWYAAYTRANHEKRIAQQLAGRKVECFLPLYETVHRWKDRRKRLQLPLFPGYVFVRLPLRDRLKVLTVPSVVRFVSCNGLPVPLPGKEIEALRDAVERQVRAEPHPYLTVGSRVRILRGPLEGFEGILLRRKGGVRVVVSINLIQRSIAADLDASDVLPVGQRDGTVTIAR